MSTYSLNIESKQICFQMHGTGAPVVLLHASPLSSKSLKAFIELLSQSYTVIAPDTPGYGLSEKPDQQPSDINYYAHTLRLLLDALHIEAPAIYGTATGAQIAIRYGLEYPDHVSRLFLDNTAHFTEEERESIIESYFPNFEVQADGSHLNAIWHTVDNLFKYFPWCCQDELHKLNTPPLPLVVLNSVMTDYLRSGREYHWAYEAAFKHEDKNHIYDLKVPTTIFRWESSIIKKYTDRIFDIKPPEHIVGHRIAATVDRYAHMYQLIQKEYMASDYQTMNRYKEASINKSLHIDDLPVFPESKVDGTHWLEAWKILESSPQLNLKNHFETNQFLIQWAEDDYSF